MTELINALGNFIVILGLGAGALIAVILIFALRSKKEN